MSFRTIRRQTGSASTSANEGRPCSNRGWDDQIADRRPTCYLAPSLARPTYHALTGRLPLLHYLQISSLSCKEQEILISLRTASTETGLKVYPLLLPIVSLFLLINHLGKPKI